MNYKFAQINLASRGNAKSFSDIFLAEVDVDKELRMGKLFVLVEIDSNRNDGLKLINFLLAEISKNYYQNERYFFKEAGLLKIDHLLEAALADTNKALVKFSSEQKIPVIRKNFNLTVGVVHKDFLYFSVTGKNKAFLVAKVLEKDQLKNKLMNILDESKGSVPETESKKYLFSHIISGPLRRGSYAFFTNEALPEYFSEKKLSDIIATLPPAGAAEQIKNDLSNINTYSSFLGLIIKNLKTEKTTQESLLINGPAEPSASLSYLDKTEKQTETFLSPSGLIPVKKWGQKIISALQSRSKKFLPKNDRFILLGEKIISKRRANPFSPKKAFQGTKTAAMRLAGFGWYHASKIRFSPRAALASIVRAGKKTIAAIISGVIWLKNLKPISKGLLGAGIICLILFSLNLFWLSNKKKGAEEERNFTQLAEDVAQKQNQIEANLLYGNEKGAKELLLEIKNLLGQIPQKTKDQQNKYAELKAKFDAEEIKLSHLVNIENPKEIANFSLVAAAPHPSNIIKSGNKIFSVDSPNSLLFKVDLGKAATSLPLPAEYQGLSSPSLDKGGSALFKTGGIIAALDPATEKWESRPLDYPDTSSLGNFSIYNNRLYFLAKTKNEIVRFKQNGAAYSESMNWLTDAVNFNDAVDIDIDGNVYVLYKDGYIQKFYSGKSVVLKLDALTRPIEEADAIQVTPSDGGYIYILEAKNRRLIVFDKSGQYAMQYQSDKFDKLKDFFVDEKAKKIYFLNGAIVYEVDLQTIK
ncbi:MAG: hypothetical protein WC715_04775 [Patescibacteria group bacterium]|jgi:hypothetical protein